jgi:hypothetical protein
MQLKQKCCQLVLFIFFTIIILIIEQKNDFSQNRRRLVRSILHPRTNVGCKPAKGNESGLAMKNKNFQFIRPKIAGRTEGTILIDLYRRGAAEEWCS